MNRKRFKIGLQSKWVNGVIEYSSESKIENQSQKKISEIPEDNDKDIYLLTGIDNKSSYEK